MTGRKNTRRCREPSLGNVGNGVNQASSLRTETGKAEIHLHICRWENQRLREGQLLVQRDTQLQRDPSQGSCIPRSRPPPPWPRQVLKAFFCPNPFLQKLPSLPPQPATFPAAGYLECGSHVGEVCNAASDDEDLAWIWSKREVKKGW